MVMQVTWGNATLQDLQELYYIIDDLHEIAVDSLLIWTEGESYLTRWPEDWPAHGYYWRFMNRARDGMAARDEYTTP
jgi:hypothetical protein